MEGLVGGGIACHVGWNIDAEALEVIVEAVTN